MQRVKNDIYLAEQLSGKRLNDCRKQFNQVLSGGGIVDGTLSTLRSVGQVPGKLIKWKKRRTERQKAEHCRKCSEEGGRSYVVGIDEVKDLQDILEAMLAKVHAIIAKHSIQQELQRRDE